MPESSIDITPDTWNAAQCPFTIEYAPRMLDDIRLAVVDAFFSLPRGGAEIGGVLLGRHTAERVTILEYAALDCEHATGPSFVLSPRDEAELLKLLDRVKTEFPELEPVGWYHSHTRSEIFLSEGDQDIHNRFFPEPWQVALVFKPHTFQPMRCGFFFREADGSLHTTESYQEFTLEAMPLRMMPTGIVPPMAETAQRETGPAGSVIEVSPAAMAETAAAPAALEAAAPESPAAAEIPAVLDAPKFATVEPRKSGPWVKIGLAAAVCCLVCLAGFEIGQNWLPKVLGQGRRVALAAPAAPLTLSVVDAAGQLQIRWDRSAPVVQQGTAGVLTIRDGGVAAQEIRLDQDRLRSGSFVYARSGERVDIDLAVEQSSGVPVKAVATFVGKAPVRAVTSDETAKLKRDLADQIEATRKAEKQVADQSLLVSRATKMQNDLTAQGERIKKLEKSLSEAAAQAAEAARLRKDLAAANDRNRQLSKSLSDTQEALKQQQRRRMGNQDPGKE